MYKKKVSYQDYNGNMVEDTFYFHLNKAEILEMEMTTNGGLTDKITKMVASNNASEIINLFKDLVLKAYGEKSEDGMKFVKFYEDDNGKLKRLSTQFLQTPAYDALFMDLIVNHDTMAEFVNGIIPNDIRPSEAEVKKAIASLPQINENA